MRPLLDVTRSARAASIEVVTRPPAEPGIASVEPLLFVKSGSKVDDRLNTMLVMLVRVGGGTKISVRVTLLPLAKVAIAGKSIAPVAAL